MSILVTLTPEELAHAQEVAILRQADSAAKGAKNSADYSNGSRADLNEHTLGAQGEAVWHKLTGMEWNWATGREGKPDFYSPDDVEFDGTPIDVKARPGHPGKRDLMLMEDHLREDWLYVLVLGEAPTFEVAGCIWGENVKLRGKIQRQRNGVTNWIVKDTDLAPIPDAWIITGKS